MPDTINQPGLQMLLEEDYGTDLGQQRVLCPLCGFEYVHLESVDTFPKDRGTVIEVRYWCEHSHRFTIRQQFHKGQIFVETTALPWKEPPEEMWRD